MVQLWKCLTSSQGLPLVTHICNFAFSQSQVTFLLSPPGWQGFFFRGQRIWETVMTHLLLLSKGISKEKQVCLANKRPRPLVSYIQCIRLACLRIFHRWPDILEFYLNRFDNIVFPRLPLRLFLLDAWLVASLHAFTVMISEHFCPRHVLINASQRVAFFLTCMLQSSFLTFLLGA